MREASPAAKDGGAGESFAHHPSDCPLGGAAMSASRRYFCLTVLLLSIAPWSFDGANLWVANDLDGTVTKIPSTK
jgi:hypothetical protein